MNNSAEENKLHSEFIDTASSQFFPYKSLAAIRSELPQQPISTQCLDDKISRVRQTLLTSKQLITRLQSNQQLLKYVEEVQQELAVVKARSTNQLNNVKSSFEKNYSSLQRELAALKKSWQIVREKAQADIEEQMGLFKADIKKDQTALSKLFNSANNEIKAKVNGLTLEIKETKRLRGLSSGSLMNAIEEGRARLEALTESERKRRNEYERIVLGLLDRTVDQGQRIMRRIC